MVVIFMKQQYLLNQQKEVYEKLELNMIFMKKNGLMFIQSITQYCPNLKSVALFYQDDHLVIRELEKLFSTCSQLERLVIVCEDYYNDSYDKLLDTVY